MLKRIFVPFLILVFSVLILSACNGAGTEFTVNFNTNGGNTIDALTVSADTTSVTLPADPVKEGYVFDGWYFDNETFAEEVTSTNIIAKVVSGVTSVTVYAKWISEDDLVSYADATDALKLAAATMYTSLEGVYHNDLDAEDAARLTELITLLELNGENLGENYDIVDGLLWYQDLIDKTDEYLNLLELIQNPENELTDEQLNALKDYEYYYIYESDTYEEKVAEANSNIIYWAEFAPADAAELNLCNEFLALAWQRLDYQGYQENLGYFNDDIEDILGYFTEGDIRNAKIKALADYISEFDYSTIISEDYESNPDAMLEFIFGMIEGSGFTTDDVGIFVFNYLQFMIDKGVEDLESSIENYDEEIAYYTAEIADTNALIEALDPEDIDYEMNYQEYTQDLEEDQRYLEICTNNKAQAQDDIVTIETLQDEITLAMVTGASEIFVGVIGTIVNNNIIGLIYNLSEEEQAPTLTEFATVLSAAKQACFDLEELYSSTDWTTIKTALEELSDVFGGENSRDEFILQLINPVISSESSPFELAGRLGNVIDIFDEAAVLDVFLNEITVDGKRDYEFDEENEYLRDNLVILEAKLIIALTDNTYNADTISDAYDVYFTELKAAAALVLQEETDDYYGIIASEKVIDYVTDLLKEKIVISQSRYTTLQEVAALNFVSSGTSPVTDIMYEATIFCDAMRDIEDYIEDVENFNTAVDGGFQDEDIEGIALILYIYDVDKTDLDEFVTFTEALDFNKSDEFVNAQMISGLYQCFAEEDVASIIIAAGRYFAEFAEEMIAHEQLNAYGIPAILDELENAENPLFEDTVYFALDIIKAMSDIMLEACDPLTGEMEYADFADAAVIELNEIKTAYALEADQDALVNILSKALIVLRDMAKIAVDEGEEDIDIVTINALYDGIIVFAEQYGFMGTIDKAIAVLEELNTAGGPDIFDPVEAEPDVFEDNYRMFIFLANFMVITFDDGTGSIDADFIAYVNALDDNITVEDIFQVIIAEYANIKTIAAYDYEVEPDAAFDILVETVFGGIDDAADGQSA